MAGVDREVSFREPDDRWLTRQMEERGVSRSAVVHDLIRAERERDAARVRHGIRGHLNAAMMLAAQSQMESQDPGLTYRMRQIQDELRQAGDLLTELAGEPTRR